MKVERTYDKELIKSVLTNPVIYEVITNDRCPPVEEFDLVLDGTIFLHGLTDKTVGIVNVHEDQGEWYVHIHVLPEMRDHAKAFAEECINWILTNVSSIFYAKIPENYPNVIRFAESVGMQKINVIDDNYIKCGKKYLTVLMRHENG